MAELQTIKASGDTKDIAEILADDGAVILQDLLDQDLLSRFNKELDPLLAGDSRDLGPYLNTAVEPFFGEQTRHVLGVSAKSPIFVNEILIHPVYMSLVDAILGPNCSRFQLNIAQVLERGPGATRQFLHRDEIVWIHLPNPHKEVQLASVIALFDFTKESGATVIVPGSHRWEKERQPKESDLAFAEMKAGSGVVYLGSTIHGGGANTTSSKRRRGMHLSYVVGWLRTEENHYLTTPPDFARNLSRQAQELLGYAAHDAMDDLGGYLGTVELRDPIELLAKGQL